jgi:hypothetical protein
MRRDAAGTRNVLRAKALRVLKCLLRAKGMVVSKDELSREAWGRVTVTDDLLVQCIGEIRHATAVLFPYSKQAEHPYSPLLISNETQNFQPYLQCARSRL